MIYIAIALLACYAVFLSGSRGGLLAILVTIVSFAMIYPKKGINKIFVLACMMLSVLLLWFVVKPFLPESVVNRMTIEAVVETGGTNRTQIWASMLNEIKNSSWEFILGRGIGARHTMIVSGHKAMVFAHNHMIQALYDQGIIGVIAFVMIVLSCIFRCIEKRKCVSIAILGMLALSLSLSYNPSVKFFWNMIPYAAFAFPDTKVGNAEVLMKSVDSDI